MKPKAFIGWLTWVAILLGAGWVDIETTFQPLLTVAALIFVTGLWLYRRFLDKLSPMLFIHTRLVVVTAAVVAINLSIGLFLNRNVNSAAQRMVTAIYGYKSIHGKFPDSISDLNVGDTAQKFSLDRLQFGSRYHYLPKRDTFSFAYQVFPAGGKFWDAANKRFDDALD